MRLRRLLCGKAPPFRDGTRTSSFPVGLRLMLGAQPHKKIVVERTRKG